MTKEKPWHIEISDERVECSTELLAIFESKETGGPVAECEISYRGTHLERSFWIDNRKIAGFDMWGNLVIYNPDK